MGLNHVASDRGKVGVLTEELLNLSNTLKDIDLKISAKVLRGIHLFISGDLLAGASILKDVMDHIIEHGDIKQTYTTGIENFCWASSCLGFSLWLNNNKEEGRRCSDEALARARKINHAPTLCLMLFYRGILYQWDRDKKNAKKVTDEAIELADKHNLLAYKIYAETINYWATDKIELLDKVVDQLEAMGCNLALTNYRSLPAEQEFKIGNKEKAIPRIDKCLKMCEINQEFYYQEELFKMKNTFLKVQKIG